MKVNFSKSSVESCKTYEVSKSLQQPMVTSTDDTYIAYCMKCRNKVHVVNAIIGLNARNIKCVRGNCSICNTKVNATLPKEK